MKGSGSAFLTLTNLVWDLEYLSFWCFLSGQCASLPHTPVKQYYYYTYANFKKRAYNTNILSEKLIIFFTLQVVHSLVKMFNISFCVHLTVKTLLSRWFQRMFKEIISQTATILFRALKTDFRWAFIYCRQVQGAKEQNDCGDLICVDGVMISILFIKF